MAIEDEIIAAFGGDANAAANWVEEFARQHNGMTPDKDRDLLSKGFSPADAVRNHLAAREWGAQMASDFPAHLYPERYDARGYIKDEVWRSEQPQRWWRTDDGRSFNVGGFGGFPPERWESLERDWAKERKQRKQAWDDQDQLYRTQMGASMNGVPAQWANFGALANVGTQDRRRIPPPPPGYDYPY